MAGPKKASDYEKEKCFITPSGKRQHKKDDCRYTKGKTMVETNRREAYLRGAQITCVWLGVKLEHVTD